MAAPLPPLVPMPGGYSPDAAMKLMNAHFSVLREGSNVIIANRLPDGSVALMGEKAVKLLCANIRIRQVKGDPKPAYDAWLNDTSHTVKRLVFRDGPVDENTEVNAWRGLAIPPLASRAHVDLLLWHLRYIICNGDDTRYEYLMDLLAFTVQYPTEMSDVMLLLRSRLEGAGKGLLFYLLQLIFGSHACVLPDLNESLSKYNSRTQNAVVVICNEVIVANKMQAAKLRDVLVSKTRTIEEKFMPSISIDNVLTFFGSTNEDSPLRLGAGSRRVVMFNVSEAKVGDKSYFKQIVHEMRDLGGAGEFLDILLKRSLVKADGHMFHPRDFPRTSELLDAQKETADSVLQWLIASCEDGSILAGDPAVPNMIAAKGVTFDRVVPTTDLHNAYAAYTRFHLGKPENAVAFGIRMAQVFGIGRRRKNILHTNQSGKVHRGRGWDIPSPEMTMQYIEHSLSPLTAKKPTEGYSAFSDVPPFKGTDQERVADLLARWPRDLIDARKPVSRSDLLTRAQQSEPLREALAQITALAAAGRPATMEHLRDGLDWFDGKTAAGLQFKSISGGDEPAWIVIVPQTQHTQHTRASSGFRVVQP